MVPTRRALAAPLLSAALAVGGASAQAAGDAPGAQAVAIMQAESEAVTAQLSGCQLDRRETILFDHPNGAAALLLDWQAVDLRMTDLSAARAAFTPAYKAHVALPFRNGDPAFEALHADLRDALARALGAPPRTDAVHLILADSAGGEPYGPATDLQRARAVARVAAKALAAAPRTLRLKRYDVEHARPRDALDPADPEHAQLSVVRLEREASIPTRDIAAAKALAAALRAYAAAQCPEALR